jgi:acyl carrier protein
MLEKKSSDELEITVNLIRKCVSDNLNISIEFLNAQSGIGDFPEWNSLGHITIYLAIQEFFNISIPLEDAGDIRSIEDWAYAVNLVLN